MQRKSQLGRTYYYAMNPLTQVLIQSLSFYNKSKGNKFSMSTLEIYSSPLYVRVFFFGQRTCAGLFSPPPTSSEEKMVRPLVFCLKMPPEYQFVLQFVAIRRPQRPQRYKPIYDKRQNKHRLVVKSLMCNCN